MTDPNSTRGRWDRTMGKSGNPLGRLHGTSTVGVHIVECHVDTIGGRANVSAWHWSPGEEEPETDKFTVPRTQHELPNGEHRPGWWVQDRQVWYEHDAEAVGAYDRLKDDADALDEWINAAEEVDD